MKKPVILSFLAGAVMVLIAIVFFFFQGTSAPKDTQIATGNLNTYDEEAERAAEALSDTGIVSANVVVETGTGGIEVVNSNKPIPDIHSQKEIPTGKLIRK